MLLLLLLLLLGKLGKRDNKHNSILAERHDKQDAFWQYVIVKLVQQQFCNFSISVYGFLKVLKRLLCQLLHTMSPLTTAD